MAKKEDGFDGIPIRLKRTIRSIQDSSDQSIINTEPLLFGEPLYLDKDNYIVIGPTKNRPDENGNLPADVTLTSKLQVYSADPRELADYKTFYSDIDSADRVQLLCKLKNSDKISKSIYPKLRMFTQRDELGIPTDITDINKKIKITALSGWKKVDENGHITNNDADKDTSGYAICPAAISINITNMNTNVIPFISLALDNSVWQTTDIKKTIKQLKKSFGNITSIYSTTNNIVVICGVKPIKDDLYIDVFGG